MSLKSNEISFERNGSRKSVMFAIIGAAVVSIAVVGGYLLEHGNLSVIIQPTEVLIIFGAAIGGFIIASPIKVIKAVVGAIARIFKGKAYSQSDYQEMLIMLSQIFGKIRKEGLLSIESDVDRPKESKIFSKYPKFMKNHHASNFVFDTLRMVMATSMASHELEGLLDTELEALHEELLIPFNSISTIADSLPGLGIVAAVLGVVLTMQKINEPPAVLGQSIAAALVGTFLGVLMCYGFVGPISRNLEYAANEEKDYLMVLKVSLLSFVGGAPPPIAVEFGRRVVPTNVRPSFLELEKKIKEVKKKA